MIFEIFSLAVIIQLFALLNPLSSFPVLLSAYKSKLNVRKIAANAVLLAFLIALIIALFGQYLFELFGISLDSFKIAGGIVLLLLGLETIRAKEKEEKVTKTDSLISIIATPLLTGPGTMSYITIKAYEIGKVKMVFNIFFAFILVAIVFMVFSFSVKKINPKVINISSRILGLFLTAVAIQLIATGIQGVLHIVV
jgi:multiple antibiotic resistance protein